MSEQVFCYCCRVHHPREQMQRYDTRLGPRWRCRRTVEAAARSVAERDAFGRQQTAQNRDLDRRIAEYAQRWRELAASC